MKKTLLLFLGCLTTIMVWAVKADPTPTVITQADGTKLTVMTFGDENLHWSVTSDGVLLSHVGYNYYVARVNADGVLEATTQLAHEKAQRSAAEQQLVAAQDKVAFRQMVQRTTKQHAQRRIPIGESTPHYFPHMGSPKALVILIDFPDCPFTVNDPYDNFNDYLNKEGVQTIQNRGNREDRNYGSVRQYFSDMSGGLFTPQFDIYGPYRLSNESTYYGSGVKDNMTHINEMITEACTQADNDVNFEEYDSDNDTFVDLVYIIYAGYSESITGNSSNCIWPKSGTTSITGKFDGKKVSRYGINNELNYYPDYNFSAPPYTRINGIGLFCHEFSHTMGLPDHYTNNYWLDNVSMEYWDIMDGGTYTDNGYCPTPYTPWEMETMEWKTYETLDGAQHVTLQPNEVKKIVQDGTTEFLYLQNIRGSHYDFDLKQKTVGTGWSRQIPGHGLIVHHIDYNNKDANHPKTSVGMSDYPNFIGGDNETEPSYKPGLTIIPADGLVINAYRVFGEEKDRDKYATDQKPWSQEQYLYNHYGDPYPGSQNVTNIELFELNNTVFETPLYNITENMETGTVTFDYLEVIVDGIRTITTDRNADQNIYSIAGQRMPQNTSLKKGIYVKGGKKIVIK